MNNYLKKRLIPVILVKEGNVVQSIKFSEYKIIGKPVETISRLNKFGSDEIILLDISKKKEYMNFRQEDNLIHSKTFFDLVDQISKINFLPLAAGGGIRSLKDIEKMLKIGCDKVVINTLCIENQGLINEAAKIFGSQCLVGSIDYYEDSLKRLVVKNGSKIIEEEALSLSKKLEDLGIGEIIFNSINRDGMKKGYDIDFLKKASKEINIPVIVCGGAGSWRDMFDVVKDTNCDAVAASNIFHHVEYSTYLAKKFLYDNKLNFRKAELFHN